MRIEYTCTDRSASTSRTIARWPSIALLYWLGRTRPRREIVDPEPCQVYVVGAPIPGDTADDFMTVLYAAIEAKLGFGPPFPMPIPGPDPEQPAEDNFKFPPGGQDYQDRCMEILKWLHERGDIVSLNIEADRPTNLADIKRIFGIPKDEADH